MPVSHRYEHDFHTSTPAQYENLVTLARYLVLNAAEIDAAGGLAFESASMAGPVPEPADAADWQQPLPPLAHGPRAAITARAGEDWQDYCQRAFGIRIDPPGPFCQWLQSPLWRKTEPSAKGAGLRIAYVLDLGVPCDHIEIAMGQAWTDYDRSGFVWDKLDLPSEAIASGILAPIREWPAFTGDVEASRRRASITLDAGNLRQRLIDCAIASPQDIAGLHEAEIRVYEAITGPMPHSYRQVLSIIGHRAGRLVDDAEFQIYANQLVSVNRLGHAKRIVWQDRPGSDPVPEEAIFIGASAGSVAWFILPSDRGGADRRDSPVFVFDTATGRVRHVAISVWEWMQRFVDDAAQCVESGKPARNARLGAASGALPPGMSEDAFLQRDRRITIALVLGAVMFGVTITLVRLTGQ